MASDKYITTSHATSISGPTLSTQVGYILTASGGGSISTTIPNDTKVSSVSSITVGSGTWIVYANRNINNSQNATRINWSLGDTPRTNGPTGNTNDYKWGVSTLVPNSQLNYMSISGVVSATVSTIVYLNLYLEYSGTPVPSITSTANMQMYAVRIA